MTLHCHPAAFVPSAQEQGKTRVGKPGRRLLVPGLVLPVPGLVLPVPGLVLPVPNRPPEALAAACLGRVLPVPNKPPLALAATSLGFVLPVPKSPPYKTEAVEQAKDIVHARVYGAVIVDRWLRLHPQMWCFVHFQEYA